MLRTAALFATLISAVTMASGVLAQNGTGTHLPDISSGLNVAIVRYIRPSPHEPIIEPTIDALKKRFGGKRVRVTYLTMKELEEAIRNKKVDVFISSAGFYRFNVINGARDLATLASFTYPNPDKGDASSVIVRADTGFQSFSDLQAMRIAAPSAEGFTMLRVKGELTHRGYDPDLFFSQVIYTGPDEADQSIDLLRTYRVQAAAVRLCWLEMRLREHPDEVGFWRVIEPKNDGGACQASTDLYPSWIIATTPATDPEISRIVTQTVLSMPPNSAGQYWSVSTDLSSVDRLYQGLKVGPYRYLREWNARRIWNTFQIPIVLLIFFVVGLILHCMRVTQLVNHRTAELKLALERERKLKAQQLETNAQLTTLWRTGLVGRISSMVAHELRQPLSALDLYGKALLTLLTREKASEKALAALSGIIKQTERISSIAENVRSYAGISKTRRTAINLRDVVERSIATWRSSGHAEHVAITFTAPASVRVEANALEWELVSLNLIRNASEALAGRADARIIVQLYEKDDGGVRLSVGDNGPGLSDDRLALLGDPVKSEKANGLGLGLSIVQGIVENHGARIHFYNHPLGGFVAEIDLPPSLVLPHSEKGAD